MPLVGAFLLTFVLTPVARRLAVRIGNIDRPLGNKIHKRATPLMGGTAIFAGFAIAVSLALPLSRPLVGVLVGGCAAVSLGVLDERLNLSPLAHGVAQVAAAALAMIAGVGVLTHISIPTSGLASRGLELPLALGVVVTLVWLVGMMNTINFLDGLDGLTTGVSAIAALLLAAWAIEPHRFLSVPHEDLVLPLALAGALIGFLPYNWHPARIFMGDSGSMFLGLTLGSLSIIGPAKLGTALLVLSIPVLDVAWAIVRRQLQGRSFLSGDKQHVYHRMMEVGMSHRSTVLVLYFLVASFAVLDLVLFKFAKLVAFLVLTITIGVGFVLLEARAGRRKTASPPELEGRGIHPQDAG